MGQESGFTLIELVMVIVILAILGAVAIPQFVNLQAEARLGNETGVVAGVRAGILTYFLDPARGNRSAYPPTLDSAVNGPCSQTNPCFTNVLANGGITDQWFKKGDYAGFSAYRSPTSASATNWFYYPATGQFVEQ